MSDDDLLHRSQRGDRKAFDALTEKYRDRVLCAVAAMVGDDAQAEDLVQEALRKAWEALPKFERRCKVSTWLYQIALNLARNHIRDRAHRAAPESPSRLDARPAERRTVLSSVIRHERAELIALAIDRLPPTLREAFVLHYIEDLPYEEIAEIVGANVGTLQVRAVRAKKLLRKQLGPLVDTVWRE